ncbi:hypothetical protein Q5H92_23215 [Hymenobacter sp. M29]|uniref:TonB C-terminal domain-containing protein n=1 Tax=Hymenobacter mellowenesis TaxID=3063995 RepID=A0ABT9AHE3_9BACT|nr:hypothetical protein [Hymenobacter sp. M29]MDO7849293.1 hypothetical protein [Hymenobacter sp. M29]
MYPNGITGLVSDIQKAAVLPPEYLVKHNNGVVTIKVLVNARAAIVGASVLKAPSPAMGQTVLDALKHIPPFEAAGTVDEENVAVMYTLPIIMGTPANGIYLPAAYNESPSLTYLADEFGG